MDLTLDASMTWKHEESYWEPEITRTQQVHEAQDPCFAPIHTYNLQCMLSIHNTAPRTSKYQGPYVLQVMMQKSGNTNSASGKIILAERPTPKPPSSDSSGKGK